MKKSDIKIILIITSIIIIILLAILLVLYNLKGKDSNTNINNVSNETNTDITSLKAISGFKTVKEIIEFSSSKYIGEENANEDGYSTKYFVEFKYNLYHNNSSMEKYYLSIINRIAYLFRYNKNVILVDEKNDIEIRIICNGSSIERILINGDENYYLKKENEKSMNKSVTDDNTELNIQASEIKNTLSNKWNYKEDIFGTKDSFFNKYDIYSDEKVNVRTIQNKVYNIVFDSEYDKNILNNLKVTDDFDTIIKKLGEPTFGKTSNYIIGYKNEDLYVFFSKNEKEEVSVYPNLKYDNTEFENLLKQYIDSEINIKSFMNELTYLWPDYSSYEYNKDYVKISYPQRGLKIEYGSNDSEGISIYENYEITDYTKGLAKDGIINCYFDKSLYLEEEEERTYSDWGIRNSTNEDIENYEESENNITSSKYAYSYKRNSENDIVKVFFISKDKKKYNDKELTANVFTGFFINDDYFVYSIKNDGIYAYNVILDERKKLIEDDEKRDYELKKFKDGVLYFDDEKVSLE